METFWIILVAVIGIGLLAGIAKKQKIEEAKKAYVASLSRLKSDPTNAGVRQATLELGRKYSNLTRNSKGITLFDEVALMNDLNAAAGGAMTIANLTAQSGLSLSGAMANLGGSIGDRLRQLSRLKEEGLIDDSEFRERRARILSEL
jgi:hypothetical protein